MGKRITAKMRVAMIGCGRVGESHIAAVRHLGGRIALCGLADTDPSRAEALLDASGLHANARLDCGIFTDYRIMLADRRPDIVAITTPSGTHVEMGIACMEAGAHIIMEKPMTMSLTEADRLLDCAVKNGRLIAVGHKFRYIPLLKPLRDALAGGLIGDLLQGRVHIRWGHDQAYYDQAAWRGTWRMDGGALLNQSVHGLDLLLWLMGSPVRRVTGMLAQRAHRMEAEDLGCAVLELASGALCLVEGTTNTPPKRQEAEIAITGTRGTLVAGIRGGIPYLSVRDAGGKSRTAGFLARTLGQIRREGRLGDLRRISAPHTLLYADLLDAIASGRAPLADGEAGRTAVEAVLAIYRSALEDHPVELPGEDFPLELMTAFFD